MFLVTERVCVFNDNSKLQYVIKSVGQNPCTIISMCRLGN